MSQLLPEQFEEQTIDCMMVGESGYTVPWAMWVDTARRCWLHPRYTVRSEPFGTATMRIERQDDGYHVEIAGHHKYTPRENPGYSSPSDTEWIPVYTIRDR